MSAVDIWADPEPDPPPPCLIPDCPVCRGEGPPPDDDAEDEGADAAPPLW